MAVDTKTKEETPQEKVKRLENVLQHLKDLPEGSVDQVVTAMQEQLVTAKQEVTAAKPLPVRLSACR